MISFFSGLRDPELVVISFLWILFLVIVGETARRLRRWSPTLTRKLIHVGVGFWALPTALWFDSPGWAILCPATFVILNTISYRLRLMAVIEEEGRGSPGTIYFPLIFVGLILALWPAGQRAASVAGLFALGFGDAAASVIGRRWGRHRYTLGRITKSWEGSLAMLGVSFGAILVGTWACGLDRPAWIASLVAAAAATAAEAPAGRGLDNLTVPVASALAFWALHGIGA